MAGKNGGTLKYDLPDVIPAAGKGLISDGTEMVSGDVVTSADVGTIVKLTQAAYDLLTPDANTLYIIVG